MGTAVPIWCITEGSSSNLFIVAGGGVVTPPLRVGILDGITRRPLLDLARARGLTVEERSLRPGDLKSADEAFITSSIRGVLPVVRVDGVAVATGRVGPVTRLLSDAYLEHARRTAA